MLHPNLREQEFISICVILFILYQLTSSESDLKENYKANELVFKNNGEEQTLSRFHVKLLADDEKDVSVSNNPSQGEPPINNIIPNSNGKQPFFGHRIVHLDLKGAPPKISFIADFFPLIKHLGATGVIIEYEDMFPYSRIEVSSMNAYSKNDIESILKLCKDNELEVIPLIQTFGHLEFVLKLKQYKHIREISKYPQVVCPTHNETIILLKEMVDEILMMHPYTKFIHIGCDEVYHLGKCYKCVKIMGKERWTKQQLFLNHVTTLARYIHEKYPEVTTLTWDDEFRKISLQDLTDSGIGSLVEPVVWKYTPNIDTFLPDAMWDKYATVFKSVWIATAFKGATGPDKYITDIDYHLRNHKAWMKLVAKYGDTINFKGIVLTGWQRYDHFSVLCELLPVGIPSLATNLIYIMSNDVNIKEISNTVGSILQCGPGFLRNNVGSHCGFPGTRVYEAAIKLNVLSDQIKHMKDSNVAKGWFTEYNIEIGISNPSHVEEATFELERFETELFNLQQDMTESMNEIYNSNTVNEWMDTYMKPLMKILKTMSDGKTKILEKNEWPRRPFLTQGL